MSKSSLLAVVGRPEAWTPEALVAAGFDAKLVQRAIVDGPSATPERARTKVHGRGRTEPTTFYVWGPDFAFLAEGRA